MMITTATASTNGYSDTYGLRKGPLVRIANGLLVSVRRYPDGYVTRAMMATIITKAFGATNLLTFPALRSLLQPGIVVTYQRLIK